MVKFSIGLFHELNPKLLRVVTRAIYASSVILFFLIRQEGIYNDLDPFSVLKELERNKSFVKVLTLDYELLNKLRAGAYQRKRRDEVASCKDTMFGVDVYAFDTLFLLND